MKKLVLVSILVVILLNSCSKQPLSPEDTMKIVLNNLIKGNYETAFSYMIDGNGNPISEQMKQTMIDSIKRTPVSGYKILGTTDLSSAGISVPEAYKNNAMLKDAKVIRFNIIEKETQKTQEGLFIAVKQGDSWKAFFPITT